MLITAAALRFSFAIPGAWDAPWTPHHFDEHILPYEALALWEGVTPREVGWPSSTFRFTLSALYLGPLIADQGPALARADNAADAMHLVAAWSGSKVADGESLYVIARSLSAAIGVLHVLLAMFAARAWLGGDAALLAGALVAVSPLAVSHSQLVLADVTGACIATGLLGLLPRAAASLRRAPWLGVVAGLAAASKVHFGLWLLGAIAALWMPAPDAPTSRRQRFTATVGLLTCFSLTLLAFVPWLWTNPALGLKEFAGVVLVKTGSGAGGVAIALAHAGAVLQGLGLVVLVGAVMGARRLIGQAGRLGAVIVALVLLALTVLSASALVFGRYGLVLLPGATLMAAAGWQWLLARQTRIGVAPAALGLLLLGLPQSLLAIDEFRHTNSYHVAHDWIAARLPDRASVVIYSEDNQFLPRTQEQLAQCEAYAVSDVAYQEKWRTNGVRVPEASGMPMQRALVNDELFHAFWCGRERLVPRSPSFVVHRFHADPRFQTMDVPTLEREFREGLEAPNRGFDAVLLHWPLFPDLEPVATFETTAGPRLYLYLRPGVPLRDRLDR